MNHIKIDLSLTIVSIIALCAIISPVIVAVINNRYNLKMKKLEIVTNHKTKAFEEYLNYIGLFIAKPDYDNDFLEKYGEAFGNALFYASPSSRELMIQINREVDSKGNISVTLKLEQLCSSLQKDIKI